MIGNEVQLDLELLKTRIEAQNNLAGHVLKAATIYIIIIGLLFKKAFGPPAVNNDVKITIAIVLSALNASCLLGNLLLYRVDKCINSDILNLIKSFKVEYPLVSFNSKLVKFGLVIASLVEFFILLGSLSWLLCNHKIFMIFLWQLIHLQPI